MAELLEPEARESATVEKVLLSAELPRGLRRDLSARARQAGAVTQVLPRDALERLLPGVRHQGVAARLACGRVVELDAVLADLGAAALLVLVDGVEDPRNLGAIVRSAAAAGADAVLLPRRRAAGLTAAASKAAAGALERIPIARVGSPASTLRRLSEAGLWSVGLDARGRAPWEGLDLTRPTCLVVGAEGRGLSRLVRERCDESCGFPLARGVESLNASVAVALALYEAVRQRTSAGAAPPGSTRDARG